MSTPTNEPWTYEKSGGLDYPVESGQIWAVGQLKGSTGFHVYACLDFMSDFGHSRVQELLRYSNPTLLYCDPPWNQGNGNAFRTKAGLERAEYTWLELYQRIVSYVPQTFPVWLESGRRQMPEIVSQVLNGRPNVKIVEATYYRRNPSLICYSGPDLAPVDLTGMDDEDTPGVVMQAYQKGLVFDPCAGRGCTPVHAAKLGWSSLSIELSPHRTSAGLHALAEVTHMQPHQLMFGLGSRY